MNLRCSGCGALIQSEDQNKAGYINKEVLKKRKDSDFYCKRCFELKHYNKNTVLEIENDDYFSNLEQIKKDKGLIVYIVDLLDLDGTIIESINELFKSENILLVVNKVDLFLDSLNRNKILQYVRKYLKDKNIKVKDAFLMSSFEEEDINSLIEKIKEYKNKKQNVYFVGMTNVGKSTILNKIINKYTGINDLITVSNNVNTTLSNIYIPFDDDSFLVDTPGIVNRKSLIYYLDKESYEYISPKKFIKPKTFQLNEKQSLFISGFLRIDFIEGERSSFITNFNNNLLIHRTKLENADEFYLNHADDILNYPTLKERENLGALKSKVITFDLDKKIDISIFGLGFISIYGSGKLKITSFENVKWTVREALV